MAYSETMTGLSETSEPEIECRGAHGTSRSRGEEIGRSGFQSGRYGRRGPGVYLWRESRRSTELATRWYYQARTEGRYAGDRNDLGSVIYATARTVESRFLDLSEPEAIDEVDALAASANVDLWNTREIAGLYARYIRQIEGILGHRIDVFETVVSGPKPVYYPDGKGHPYLALGLPRCYVVVETSILSIDRSGEIN